MCPDFIAISKLIRDAAGNISIPIAFRSGLLFVRTVHHPDNSVENQIFSLRDQTRKLYPETSTLVPF